MQGGGSGGRGSSGRADRPLVICGPGTLSLPWTHLSSRTVGKKRGGDGGDGEGMGGGGGGCVGAPGQKMVYNDSHFQALSSLAVAVCMVCQEMGWNGRLT